MTTILAARAVRKDYRLGGIVVAALHAVSLDIAAGEFVAIMGPSGCGKSTLLNLLGGLSRPTAGQVLLDGGDLTTLDATALAQIRRTKLGFVFQTFALIPTLTVQENVEFPLLLEGAPAERRAERARDLLERVGLAAQRDFLPDELSGGQKQRVGIARALANAPAVVLADEPTGNLDRATARTVLAALAALRAEQQVTLVMVTHDAEDARQADRIVQMRDGALVATGQTMAATV